MELETGMAPLHHDDKFKRMSFETISSISLFQGPNKEWVDAPWNKGQRSKFKPKPKAQAIDGEEKKEGKKPKTFNKNCAVVSVSLLVTWIIYPNINSFGNASPVITSTTSFNL